MEPTDKVWTVICGEGGGGGGNGRSSHKHRLMAGSSKCTTNDLSCILTKLLSTTKDVLLRYCNAKTGHNGINNMWILKSSSSCRYHLTNLMSVLLHQSIHLIYPHCISVSHKLLKYRISALVHNSFKRKRWESEI